MYICAAKRQEQKRAKSANITHTAEAKDNQAQMSHLGSMVGGVLRARHIMTIRKSVSSIIVAITFRSWRGS